jgi:anti-sigma factor RsiW
MDENGHLDASLLNEYLDGVLPEVQRLVVELHISGCAQCSARLSELRRVFLTLQNLPEARLERDLSGQVVTALRPSLPVRRAAPRSLWLTTILQSFATLVIILVLLPFVAASLQDLEQRSFLQVQALYASFIQQIEPLAAPHFSQALIEAWNALGARWVTGQQAVWAALKGIISFNIGRSPRLQWSPPELALLAIVSISLWLIGNSLLLGTRWLKN